MLFVKPPAVVASDYGIAKTAGLRLTTPQSGWADEILTAFTAQYPFVPADRLVVTWKQVDETQGTAYGYIGLVGAPRVSIPLVVKSREVKPMDILIISANQGTDSEGVGDMTEDQVKPLSPETFADAMDDAPIGEVVPPHRVHGTSWTEDGSSLRLPSRGRTVLASKIPTSKEQKLALTVAYLGNKEAQAGFMLNGNERYLDNWLTSAQTTQFVSKFAAAPLGLGVAPAALPFDTDDFKAAAIVCDDDVIRPAVKVSCLDLASADARMVDLLVYEGGRYTVLTGPTKCATVAVGEADDVTPSLSASALHLGSEVSFNLAGLSTLPLKVAKLAVDDRARSIHLDLTDGIRKIAMILSPIIKEASFEPETSTWMVPAATPVIVLEGVAPWRPEAPHKVAKALTQQFPETVSFSNGQYGVKVGSVHRAAVDLDAAKTILIGASVGNADDLLAQAKTAGLVRFAFEAPDMSKHASPEGYKAAAAALIERVRLSPEASLKLAAALGDPQGVDAVLGAGLLSEDNLAEFVGLAPEFADVVSCLARLLLAIRMGFPGDENATMIAMKSLQRVADALNSVNSEIQ